MHGTGVKTGKREANIELLRMIFMAMIVMLHLLKRCGALDAAPGPKYQVAWLIEILCYCSVDGFLIIAGWVNLNSRFKLSRIGKLWGQAVFWVLLFNLIECAVNGTFSPLSVLRSFFPFSTQQYWFYTYYFVLMFFIPFLNRLVQALERKTCLGLFAVILVFFSVMPFLFRQAGPVWQDDIFYVERGYSPIWFFAVYLLGALLRRIHDLPAERLPAADRAGAHRTGVRRWAFAGLYLLGSVLTFAIGYACRAAGVYEYAAISYASPLIVMAAIALFAFFRTVRFSSAAEKIILFLAPGTFGVYLIHSNPDVVPVFIRCVQWISDLRIRFMVPALVLAAAVVFFVCLLLDLLRIRLFRVLRLDALFAKMDGWKIREFFMN